MRNHFLNGLPGAHGMTALITLVVLATIIGCRGTDAQSDRHINPVPSEKGQTSILWGLNGERFDPASRLMDFSYAGYHAGDNPVPTHCRTSISVTDFAAKGDGTQDDSAAILGAVSAASA